MMTSESRTCAASCDRSRRSSESRKTRRRVRFSSSLSRRDRSLLARRRSLVAARRRSLLARRESECGVCRLLLASWRMCQSRRHESLDERDYEADGGACAKG
eukprot:scaffold11828_cov63-Phaeocystis_antarctica.AAC.8